jgi:hypothetical protein
MPNSSVDSEHLLTFDLPLQLINKDTARLLRLDLKIATKKKVSI